MVKTVAYTAAFLWAFWGLYVLIMGLYRAKLAGRLNQYMRWMAAPYLVIGLCVDFVANVTIFTIVFAELPREWLVTQRLTRHMQGSGWRYRVARAICTKLLDVFDPTGMHCD